MMGLSSLSGNTAAAYLEYSRLPLEAYEEAVLLAKKFISNKRSGSTGGSYTTMNCIDLFDSSTLDALAHQHLRNSQKN